MTNIILINFAHEALHAYKIENLVCKHTSRLFLEI